MDFDSVTFFLHDVGYWKSWFSNVLGFRARSKVISPQHSCGVGQSINLSNQKPIDRVLVETLKNRQICIHLASPKLSSDGIAKKYLAHHPAGVGNIAFRVKNLEAAYSRAINAGAMSIQSPVFFEVETGIINQAKVSGWGDMYHTLIQYPPDLVDESHNPPLNCTKLNAIHLTAIDHAVLNVPKGEMEAAVEWYSNAFGFVCEQSFTIETPRSALKSIVLAHPEGTAKLPINEPGSSNSQIQEFLDYNQGAGIQHIALTTSDIVKTMSRLRQNGLNFLDVPSTYYESLPARICFQRSNADWTAIAQQSILVDWQDDAPDAMLLQAFTQPIFNEPTFFFEVIQRQSHTDDKIQHVAKGFGEGNFQALFEAMEREQLKRGNLRKEE